MSDVKRFVVIRHPEGVEPGTYFPEEYEGNWYDRDECGLHSRVLVISPQVLCFPVGVKFRRASDGAIADVYEPRGAIPLAKRKELEAADVVGRGSSDGGDAPGDGVEAPGDGPAQRPRPHLAGQDTDMGEVEEEGHG